MARCEICGEFVAGVPRGWNCSTCELESELGRLEAAIDAGHSDPGDEERVEELHAQLDDIAAMNQEVE